jgi:glutamate 5-kinase
VDEHDPRSLDRRRAVATARRLVVKLGTAVLTHEDGTVALARCYALLEDLARLRREGREAVLVTSGAVSAGAAALGMPRLPAATAVRQACAAVGQGRLMAHYVATLDRLGVPSGQVLVTREQLAERGAPARLRATLCTLLGMGVLPIVNENDASAAPPPSQAGGPGAFADNDELAALVAERIGADLLVLLTDVDGVYSADPRLTREARLLPMVCPDAVAPEVTAAGPRRGRGGMRSKLVAACRAAAAGCTTVVANGFASDVLGRLCAGEELGTLVPARPGPPLRQAGSALETPHAAAV